MDCEKQLQRLQPSAKALRTQRFMPLLRKRKLIA